MRRTETGYTDGRLSLSLNASNGQGIKIKINTLSGAAATWGVIEFYAVENGREG